MRLILISWPDGEFAMVNAESYSIDHLMNLLTRSPMFASNARRLGALFKCSRSDPLLVSIARLRRSYDPRSIVVRYVT